MVQITALLCLSGVALLSVVGLCHGKSLRSENKFTTGTSKQGSALQHEVTLVPTQVQEEMEKLYRRHVDDDEVEVESVCTVHNGPYYEEPSSCPAQGEHRLCSPGEKKASYCFDSSYSINGCESCEYGTFIDKNNNCTECNNCSLCGTGEEIDTPCSTLADTKCRPITPPSDIKQPTPPLQPTPTSEALGTTQQTTTTEPLTKPKTPTTVSGNMNMTSSIITSNTSSRQRPASATIIFAVLFCLVFIALVGALCYIYKSQQQLGNQNHQDDLPNGNAIPLRDDVDPPAGDVDHPIDDDADVPKADDEDNQDGQNGPEDPLMGDMASQSSMSSVTSSQVSDQSDDVPGPSSDIDQVAVDLKNNEVRYLEATETPPTSFGPGTLYTPLVPSGHKKGISKKKRSKAKLKSSITVADKGNKDKKPEITTKEVATASNGCNSDADTVSIDINQLDEVEPDTDGYYNQTISPAWPTAEQMYDEKNLFYNMKMKVKGFALVINNKSFPTHPVEKSRRRPGSEVDLANMVHLWEEVGCIVEKHEDLKGKEMLHIVQAFASKCNDPNNKCALVVIVLMSHGSQGYINGTDLERIPLLQIQELFDGKRCPYMKGKPKVFFYQACRLEGNIQKMEQDKAATWSIPEENADMFFANATTQGHNSMRHNVNGSWYVQAVCEVFLSSAHEDDLDKLMTKVNRLVTTFKGACQGMTVQQTPEHTSRLTKTLHFLPKFPPPGWLCDQ